MESGGHAAWLIGPRFRLEEGQTEGHDHSVGPWTGELIEGGGQERCPSHNQSQPFTALSRARTRCWLSDGTYDFVSVSGSSDCCLFSFQ